MTDKSKKQVKHEKHSHEKKHHGHEKVSKKHLGKVHGGNIGGGPGSEPIIVTGGGEDYGSLGSNRHE